MPFRRPPALHRSTHRSDHRGRTRKAALHRRPRHEIPRTVGHRFLLIALLALLAGCSSGPNDRPVRNRPPFAKITGGPLNGSRNSYTALVYWAGWDDDGVVRHFEYALDPPAAFAPEEIDSPETAPGVAVRRILGPAPDTDTLRVTKQTDGMVQTFDWVETRAFSRSFAFTTPLADSTTAGGGWKPDNTFSGIHTIYVRSQDDDGAHSATDRIAYTAETIVPTSHVAQPDIKQDISNLGPILTVTWDGLDPDSPDANKKPTGYLYKLLRLDTLDPPIPLISATTSHLYTRGNPVWAYQAADTLKRTFNLGTPGQYLFGVRAVDTAGAVEPFLELGRNVFKFQAFASGGRPDLTVSEATLGTFAFRGEGKVVEGEVPAKKVLRFRWSASAETYGGTIDGFSYGVDIPDLDADGEGSGWTNWGLSYASVPISFPRAGNHVFYLRARDLAGGLTLATIFLHIIEFDLDRELLLVDDAYDNIYPRDSQSDAFWRARLQAYPRFSSGSLYEYSSFGDNDRATSNPQPPSLKDLGRYKTVLWNVQGAGFGGVTALLKITGIKPILGAYLGAGGKLWLTGTMTIGATVAAANLQNADLIYPKSMVPGMFSYDFLKLHTDRISNDKGQYDKNNLARVLPFPGRPEIYPQLDLDATKLRGSQGISMADAIFDPMFDHSEPTFRGVVDSVYVYGASGPVLKGTTSTYHLRLTGIRWHDPDPDREQGRIQWFGFPLYYFLDDQAQETLDRSLDWFREETVPAP